MILSQFQAIGRDLFSRGLVSSTSGNLSIRLDEDIFITRRDCLLNSITENDLIETGINKNSRATPLACTELNIHRAIYRTTPALAIIHAHPPHAVALSLTEHEVVSSTVGGSAALGTVPVLAGQIEEKKEWAEMVAQALKERRVVLVQGHGSFAIGQLLEEAYNLTTALEECCQVLCLLRSLKVSPSRC